MNDKEIYSYNNRPKTKDLVIGLVGAVGTDINLVEDSIKEKLINTYHFKFNKIKISSDIIQVVMDAFYDYNSEYERIIDLIDLGNKARKNSNNNGVLALAVAAKIRKIRNNSGDNNFKEKNVYMINSLKHPDEVEALRQIYGNGFYLIGVYSDYDRRLKKLTEKVEDESKAKDLMNTDEDQMIAHGQHSKKTFELSDFYMRITQNIDEINSNTTRFLELIFGKPYVSPTFDEFAMFLSFSSALRSADLSRQVGAVIAKNEQIISTGANDCPRFGGGLYWPEINEKTGEIFDTEKGRDYKLGEDSNQIIKERIIKKIINVLKEEVTPKIEDEKLLDILKRSDLKDITEYGRVVHAEMEAILACARNRISTIDTTLYVTTFPCHNCAKHIIAAGIKRVVFIEPYPKSKAAEFYKDTIEMGFDNSENKVNFEPFVGVGPRKFFDLFSMNLSSGYRIKRKDKNGKILKWEPSEADIRLKMYPLSYIDEEEIASKEIDNIMEKFENGKNESPN